MKSRNSDEGLGGRAVSSPIRFGTDGWRAIIGKDFTFDNVEKVIQAYADVLKPREPMPLGYDRRFLSQEFAKTAASVLAANGIPVLISQSYCPTPCVSWMTKNLKAPGGIIITSSHNPFQWNGIKFKEDYGGSASPALTARVEKRIVENEKAGRRPDTIPFDEGVAQGRIRFFDPMKEYVAALRSQIDTAAIKASGWKIAFDPLYGAGTGYLSKVLDSEILEIHGEANPGFGGLNPEPIDKNLFQLMKLVRDERFDVGLATDGDADRIGAVDEGGNFVNSHQILALLLNHLIGKGLKGDVVKTVSTTQMIDRIASRHGLTVHETPIGFKHICQKFLDVKPLIGGEESGGIGIPSHVYERDGLLSGLLLLEIMATKKKRLGAILRDLFAEIGPYYFHRDDVMLPADRMEAIRDQFPRIEASSLVGRKVSRINHLDGLKFVLDDDSWLLMRLSGTEPLIRIYAEASDPKRVKALIDAGRSLIGL